MTVRCVDSFDEQLRLWVEGESVHCDFHRGSPDCCPDFSCCVPALLQPVEVRRAFVAADRPKRESLLMVFLGGMLRKELPEVPVHLISTDPEASS